jgi:hypothetical protein
MPDTDLEEAIIDANARRGLYGMLDLHRMGPGRLYEKISRAGLYRDNFYELSRAELPVAQRTPRVLLTGSVPPDETLHLATEAAGWNVVSELHQLSLSRFGPPVDTDFADPLQALAQHYNTCPWHVIRQRQVLEEMSVPALVLTDRSWEGDDGAAEQITDFLQELAS